jgi:hypothetical protein
MAADGRDTLLTVVYDVVETSSPGQARFELELDDAPTEGEMIARGTMVFRVVRVLPGFRDFPSVIEVERLAGPHGSIDDR